MYHEMCHAHQHQAVIEAGLGDSVEQFLDTAEGQAFLAALGDLRAALGGSYQGPGGGDPIEDHAQFCAGWYLGDYPRTAEVPFIRGFAETYWPK